MEQITIHAKLVAEQIDGMGYTNYVFEDVDKEIPLKSALTGYFL